MKKLILIILVTVWIFNENRCLAQDVLIPRNKVRVEIISIVNKGNIDFEYIYRLRNDSTAEQSVWQYWLILQESVSANNFKSPNGWTVNCGMYRAHLGITWGTPSENSFIRPGQSFSDFSFNSTSINGIVQYYIEGYAPLPSFEDGMATDSIPGYSDLTPYGPGVVGKTVGPVAVPNPFVPLNFLDTLTSYTIQSRALGWIKDQTTANKYLGYFASAKTSLGQNNTTSARTTLQKVLQDANVDSTNLITSEAYALIRYNTEYLISQLPASPSEPAYVFQVDTLIAVLQRMSNSNWIGDITFVNSLTKQLTNVRTNLEKGKVPQAGTQLQTFLNRIQKVYNNTLTKLQNGKPLPKSFLTQEGYALLSSKTTGLLTQLGSLGVSISVPGQFTTIQAAATASKPGTTIMVDVGTYNEVVNITNKDSLTLLASGSVTIQGVHIAKSQVIDIKGFIIDAANTGKDAMQIEGQENSDITIEANEIKNSSKDGIAMGKNNANTRVLNNVIANNQQNGIDFADGTSGAQYIVNNTIVRNGYNGIEAASQQELYLVNNIISFNGTVAGTSGGRYGIKRDAQGLAASITLLNNLIIGNNGTTNKKSSKDLCNTQQILNSADASNITTAGTEGSGVSSSSGAQLSDILLPDYHLTQTSIAIDKGTTNFDQLPEEDKDGNPRIRKTTIDIGAYESE
jgi:hypothetical protein